MKDLLETFSGRFNSIIIDSAPVLYVADSLSMAHIADAVVLVVRSGLTHRRAVMRVCDLLRRSNANLVGAVFNGVDLQLEQYYHYTHGASYGRQEDES